MELTLAHAELLPGLGRIELAGAMQFEHMADKLRGMTVSELTLFFSGIGCAHRPAVYSPRATLGASPQTPGVYRFGSPLSGMAGGAAKR